MRPILRGSRSRSTWADSALLVGTFLATPALLVPPLAAEPAAAGAGTIASLQNQVETRHRKAEGWTPSTLHEALGELDRVRTGPASRASILYADRTLQRIGEKSEIEIVSPSAERPGVLRVIAGSHYFSSRSPKVYGRVETPTVTAAIKGTEFVVEVAEDTTTKITMLEGVVEASNAYGTLSVERGEQAYVEPGKAPVKRIVVRPRDAVAWALYYPPVLTGRDAAHLQDLGAEGEGLARAAEMLSTGQVDRAKPLIDAAREKRPKDPVALSLASVIAVAGDRKEEGLRLAEEAVASDPRSPSAALALSFAAQASFDIPRARAMAEKAASLDPKSPVAHARVAELRMAEGDLDGAGEAAQEAVRHAPGEARALSVLGFVELARYDSAEAERLFEQASKADPALSLARLGLGIARIRRGRLTEGREELQVASSLDPDDSLLRSYLAKALYEERLAEDAGKELATAKELDPRDPTPYLYDAIRKQNENRPVEALFDLQESIDRNDNRAVYRSRLLLDQDRAVRGVDLARIYNDLGFEPLGLVTARRSADEDQSNFSSHLFLAGSYRSLPGFAPAFLSEVLQARIYQPVSVNAARPDVVNETASFNEYTALFERPRLRAFASAAYGRTNTGLEELLGDSQALLNEASLDDSRVHSGQVTGTLGGDRFAAAVGVSKLEDDGFRFNNDREILNGRAFFEYAPSYADTFQINALVGRQKTGDLPIRFVTTLAKHERFDTRLWNVGLGYHRIVSPASDLAVSFVLNATRQTAEGFDCKAFGVPCERVFSGARSAGILTGPQIEAQQVLRGSWITWVLGVGAFRGEVRIRPSGVFSSPSLRPPSLSADDEFTNAYAYATLRPSDGVDVTVGASGERVVAPSGLLVPRDAQIGQAELEFEETRVSPKLGVTWRASEKTTVRGAGFYRLSPAIGRIQTLEPTQVAGFNQFFNEPGGTRSRGYGLGVDRTFGSRVFAGVSGYRRRLDVPEAACDSPDRFSGCAGQTATRIVGRDGRNVDVSGYADAVLTRQLAFSFAYELSKQDFDVTHVNNLGLFEDHIETRRLRPGLRWFLPCGFFAGVGGTRYTQRVDLLDDLASQDRSVASDTFWIVDATAGYRLPRRYGSIVLEARNAGDREFAFYERAVEETVIPARVVTLTLNFTY